MGLFGFGNYAKSGAGVSKNAHEKKPFFQLIDMITLRFWKLINQSLIYLMFCIPGVIVGGIGYYLSAVLVPQNNDTLFELCVTISLALAYALTGPANAAMTKISRCYIEEKMLMLFSDFLDAFKENFKQGLQRGILNATCLLLFYHATIFYLDKINNDGGIYYTIALVFVVFVGAVLLFASYYSGLLIVSINLPFSKIIRNSIIISFVGIKSNIMITLYNIIVMIPILLYFPLTIFVLVILPAINSLVVVFNTYPHIYQYSIKPYYDENGLENPYEVEQENISLFED